MRKGSFSWFDLSTSDAPSAAQFYSKVVGWETTAAPGGNRPYTLLSKNGANVGGIAQIDEAAKEKPKPGWMGYILVDDVDAYTEKVQSAGGSVCRAPEDIHGVLRFSVVADPQGAAFILFKGHSTEAGKELAPGDEGNIGWNELHAIDGESGFEFYAKLFGWTRVRSFDMGPLGHYQTFATGGDAIGGVMNKTPETSSPMWLFYFNVDGIDRACKRVKTAGGRITMDTHQVPTGQWIVWGEDPQGVMFALLSTNK